MIVCADRKLAYQVYKNLIKFRPDWGILRNCEDESKLTNDEWIEVEVDERWLKRFRFSPEAKEYRADNHTMKIRVIKSKYEYVNDN